MRWTFGVVVGFAALVAAAGWIRTPDPVAPPSKPPPRSIREDDPPSTPEALAPGGPAAWTEGYREAKESTWEGSITGTVVTPGGPRAGVLVKAEWVAAFNPDSQEAARLRRGGFRRDRDGVWWAKAVGVTDESGFFTIDGLPGVPLRVSAGRRFQMARAGTAIYLRTGNP
jgi:hypothetical protein